MVVSQNVAWFLRLSINKLSVTNLTNNSWLLVNYYMVHMGLEKSLKIEKLWDIVEKPLNFPQKSLNIFESSLNKNNLC